MGGALIPLPVPEGARSVLLFGGSFDPPHAGHASLAARARDRLFPSGDAWLVLIPAARNPLKASGPEASGDDRVAMLRLAFADAPRVSIWAEELRRAERDRAPSYFIDTVRTARDALAPDADLRFLLGADQAVAFHHWRAFREILGLAAPAVLLRTPLATPAEMMDAMRATGAWTADELARWRDAIADVGVLDARATDVRVGTDGDAVSPPVRAYIESHALYRPR